MKLKFIIDKKYDAQMISDLGMDKSWHEKLNEQYKLNYRYIKQSKRDYQKSWNEINDKFARYIKQKTGYKWFYPTYYCVISVMHPGVSNWGCSNRVVRWWREHPATQRRITAYEMILSHYFKIYRHYYSSHGLTDRQVWALAEIASMALTTLTKEARSFWPWDWDEYTTDHNYPQLVDLQLELKDPFLNRKNFDEYILKGIELVKKYPEIIEL